MNIAIRKLVPFILVFLACLLFESGVSVQYADARTGSGGKSFSRSTPRQSSSPNTYQAPLNNQTGSFSRGLAGGLLGGALGGMLFGSMFGGHGGGPGILPLLILGGIAYFLYKKFSNRPPGGGNQGGGMSPLSGLGDMFGSSMSGSSGPPPPPPPSGPFGLIEPGLADIRRTDPGFDPKYFTEIASDVFFQVQAGWMRRDLQSYRHLLGEQLAREYEVRFAEMHAKGQINKLESIAVRKIEVVDAGSDGREDFATVLFTANLLDYTVDDKTGNLIEGSMTIPVKFEEEWTWARPTGTMNWKLEGIKVVNG
jgi:predicted lipid-binding transport protein (Tim44 family)